MKVMVITVIILVTSALHPAAPAPDRLQDLEQAMMNQLHRPWLTTDKPARGQHHRKGEGCKGGSCSVSEGCAGCQYAVPIVFDKLTFGIKD